MLLLYHTRNITYSKHRYSDGEIGTDLPPNQIRLPLQPLWRCSNQQFDMSSVKWMMLDNLLKLCDSSENEKRIPQNVNLIKIPSLVQFHREKGVALRTNYDTQAQFRIRILNAAGASDWSELSEKIFLTDGVLKHQKPPRAISYCVTNADITVQWPLQYGTLERRKRNLTALPAHTHQVEMMVTNGKRISKALEMLRPGMRIEIEWDGYSSGTLYKGVIHNIIEEEQESRNSTKCEDTDEDEYENNFVLDFSDPMFMGPDRKTQSILQRRFMIHYDDGDKKIETLSRRRWKLLPPKEDDDDDDDDDDKDDGEDEDEKDPQVKLRKVFVPKLTLIRESITVSTQFNQKLRTQSLISTAMCMIRKGDFFSGVQVFNQQSVVSRIGSSLFFPYVAVFTQTSHTQTPSLEFSK